MLNFSTRTCSKLFRTVVVLEFKWEKNNKPQKILWKMFVNKWFDKSWKEISGACTPQLQCKFLDASHHGWWRDFSSLLTKFICFFLEFSKVFFFIFFLTYWIFYLELLEHINSSCFLWGSLCPKTSGVFLPKNLEVFQYLFVT